MTLDKAMSAEERAAQMIVDLWGVPNDPLTDRERQIIVDVIESAEEAARDKALEEAARELERTCSKDEFCGDQYCGYAEQIRALKRTK